LAARIGAVEAAIDDAVEDHDQDEAAHGGVELEVEAARDGHASLENRLDAIEGDVDTVTGDLAQLEEHLADTADGSSGADLVGATSIAGLTGNTVQALLSALKGYIDGTASAAGNVPVGGIIAWSGSIASIPENWALCDGTGGTPDLRDRFVVGAGNGYAVGATGGAATHTLSVAEMPAHTHTMPQQSGAIGVLVETTVENISNRTASTYATSSTGGGEAHENRPPYYALAWIMRTA
ncbi:MAG TPA: hypothetical protein PLZ36_12720, partial [Armatimonadota bacterium]|nr:hypothetical protein [Armatimonadota bacterium]